VSRGTTVKNSGPIREREESCAEEGRERRDERGDSGGSHFFLVKKYIITHKPKKPN
jgi:hypothetical protein